jgi:hypothetical protein
LKRGLQFERKNIVQRTGIAAGGVLEFRLPGTDAKLKN